MCDAEAVAVPVNTGGAGRAAPQMFGFGDVELPLQSTVDTVADVVLAYLGRLVKRASSASTHRGRLTEQELLIQVRTDPRKYHRAKDLLMKWGEIKTVCARAFRLLIFRQGGIPATVFRWPADSLDNSIGQG
jgi:hypothetical protein